MTTTVNIDDVPTDGYAPGAGRARSGERRQSLLALLRGSTRGLDAAEAGREVGLHRNSARAHLDALVSVGLARRVVERRVTRGRPRVLYESATGREALCASPAQTGPAYLELAQLLAGQLTEMEDAPAKAVRAGRRWAAAVDSSPLQAGAPSPAEAMTTVAGLFERLGFVPELVPEQGRILLHSCPYVEVAREARPVVCGMHLGMLKATLERLEAPLEVTGFHPFVQQDPLLCIVTLAEKV